MKIPLRLFMSAGAAACVVLASSALEAQAADPRIPGVLPASAVLPATLSSSRIYLKTAEIETTLTDPATRGTANALATMRPGLHYIIHLDGPMTPERRAALENAGIRLAEYLPSYSYTATIAADIQLAARAADLGFVQFAMAYRPEWKLDAETGMRNYQTPMRQELNAAGKAIINVTLHQGEGLGELLAAAAALPQSAVHYAEDVSGNMTVSMTVRKQDVAGLANLESVEYIEDAFENTQRNNYADRWILQSYTSGVFPLYANGIHGENQILGHSDGSVNVNHCSFQDTVNPVGPLHRKVLNLNGTSGYDAHGTHTAATAVGYAPGQADTSNVNGMATGAKMVHSNIPVENESGIVTLFNTQYSEGARVHTNSWGTDGTTAYTSETRGCDSHCHSFEDSLVCFAVSNLSLITTPDNAKNIFAVNRSTWTPNGESICSTTAAGPTNDGRRKPEIMAPGCSIQSATGSASGACTTTSMTGTSMACPAISGLGLLVRQYFTDGYYPTGAAVPANGFTPSSSLLKAVMMNSAVDMSGVSGFPSLQEGWGRALADNALYFPGDTRKLLAYDIRNAQGFSTGQSATYNVTVAAGQSFKATLVWNEAPAAVNANPAYINNLDLEVTDANNTLYKGNVFTSGQSSSGGTADAANNVEMVLINAPTAGQWTVKVKATAVNLETQGYALVITGGVSLTPPPPPPGAFALSTPADGSTSVSLTPSLNWAASSAAVSYTVKVATDSALTNVVNSGVVSTPGYNVPASILANSTTYYWGVTATNPQGNTASTPASFSFVTIPPPCIGDVNGDGHSNTTDLGILLSNFGATVTPGTGGDLNNDGAVNSLDLGILLSNFGSC